MSLMQIVRNKMLGGIVVCLMLTAASPSVVRHPSIAQTITFAHISDTHIFQAKGVSAEVASMRQTQRKAAKNLAEFLNSAPGRHHLQFIIHSGDAVDGYGFPGKSAGMALGQISYLQAMAKRSRVPLFLSLGNHDVARYSLRGKKLVGDQSIAGEARAAWIRSLDTLEKGTFYSFERSAGSSHYLFLMLDNGYYGGPLTNGSPGRKRIQRLDYAQVYWLFRELQSHPNHIPVLVMHVPLADDEMSRQIEEALKMGSNAPVTLALVGHLHTSDAIDDIDLDQGRTIVQVHTTAFLASPNNWRRIDLKDGCAWISRTNDHDSPQRVIAFKSVRPDATSFVSTSFGGASPAMASPAMPDAVACGARP